MADEKQCVADLSPQKVVGRRRPPPPTSGANGKRDARAWREAIDRPFVPRGVYRFESHEEADQWMWATITRPSRD